MRRPIPYGYRSRSWGNPLVITSRSTNSLREQRLHPFLSINRLSKFAVFRPQQLSSAVEPMKCSHCAGYDRLASIPPPLALPTNPLPSPPPPPPSRTLTCPPHP